jgi:hypothetical protein
LEELEIYLAALALWFLEEQEIHTCILLFFFFKLMCLSSAAESRSNVAVMVVLLLLLATRMWIAAFAVLECLPRKVGGGRERKRVLSSRLP